SSRRRHTRSDRDWSSDVCSSDLIPQSRMAASSAPVYLLGMYVGGLGGKRWAWWAWWEEVGLVGLVGRGWLGGKRWAWWEIPLEEIGRASCRERVWGWGGDGRK